MAFSFTARGRPPDIGPQGGVRSGAKLVATAAEHQVRDRHQLVDGVVGEVDVVGDTGGHPRVGPEERRHPVGVTGQDDHKLLALGLHHLQEDLDGLLPVVTLVLRAVQVVGLVDEQHAAAGPGQHLFGLGRGVSDILADQIVAGDRHHPRLV
jgi:hypothetical protein